MDTTQQHIISIATGIRGLERGLEQAGIKHNVVAYVEIEAFIIANLVAAMEKGELANAPIWADVKTFPARYFHGKVHGITAGYPCQPFSIAGKRGGDNDPRHIFPHILRVIKSVEPIWVFFENVEGHLSMGYDEVYRSLHDLGYRVEGGIFSAEEVGAPHQRRRLFILGIKMEYTDNTEVERIFFGDKKKKSGTRSTSEVDNANGNGIRRKCEEIQKKTIEIKNKEQGQKREWMRSESSDSSKNVSNTDSKRNRKGISRTSPKQPIKNGYKWVATRNEPQQEWEAPRTIKPSMGSTIDGYDFRIDFLRALGNGVVAQTAAKAFLHLINKFKIS